MTLVVDTEVPPAARWALEELSRALRARGEPVETAAAAGPDPGFVIGLAGRSPAVEDALARTGVRCPRAPESLVLQPLETGGFLVCGRDERGLTYALLEPPAPSSSLRRKRTFSRPSLPRPSPRTSPGAACSCSSATAGSRRPGSTTTVHEMDIDFPPTNRNRRSRAKEKMVADTNEIFRVSKVFLDEVDKSLVEATKADLV